MSKYGFRDNELDVKKVESNVIELKKKDESKSVTYFTIPSLTVGTSGIQTAYLYLGSAGNLMLSSAIPVGTTVGFTNAGKSLGTVA